MVPLKALIMRSVLADLIYGFRYCSHLMWSNNFSFQMSWHCWLNMSVNTGNLENFMCTQVQYPVFAWLEISKLGVHWVTPMDISLHLFWVVFLPKFLVNFLLGNFWITGIGTCIMQFQSVMSLIEEPCKPFSFSMQSMNLARNYMY